MPELCQTARCRHVADDHIVIATGADPLRGGIRLCPAAGCPCFATWSPASTPRDVIIPPGPVVDQMRAQIQSRHA